MPNIEKQIQKMELDLSQVTRTKSVLNQNQIQKLWNSTPNKYKYKRPAKGGGSWDYVKVSYVRKVLDSVFGFDWDFEVDTSLAEAFEVAKLTNSCVVKGTFVGRIVDDSGRIREIKKTQFGRADVKWKTETKNGVKTKARDEFSGNPVPLDFGNDMKSAVSDCLKKCASLMGVAADVYEADEFIEITLTGADTEKAKVTQKKIKQAQDVLKEQSAKVGEENEHKD